MGTGRIFAEWSRVHHSSHSQLWSGAHQLRAALEVSNMPGTRNDRFGSLADILTGPRHDRFTPMTDIGGPWDDARHLIAEARWRWLAYLHGRNHSVEEDEARRIASAIAKEKRGTNAIPKRSKSMPPCSVISAAKTATGKRVFYFLFYNAVTQ